MLYSLQAAFSVSLLGDTSTRLTVDWTNRMVDAVLAGIRLCGYGREMSFRAPVLPAGQDLAAVACFAINTNLVTEVPLRHAPYKS